MSREEVVWCYRNLLGREPESESVVLAHGNCKSFKALVENFVSSPEYSGKKVSRTVEQKKTGSQVNYISEADFRASIDLYLSNNPPSKGLLDYIDLHFTRLLEAINVIRGTLPNGGKVLDYSSMGFFNHAVEKLLANCHHTTVTGVNYELDEYVSRYGEEKYDLCINTEVLEHLLYDPSHMFFSINKMLKPGGHLFLSTPNAISLANCINVMNGRAPTLWNQLNITTKLYYERHNRDWTPFEVSQILHEHGFAVIDIYSRDYHKITEQTLSANSTKCDFVLNNSNHEYFGDTICVLASKVREINAPIHNAWLYVLPGQF